MASRLTGLDQTSVQQVLATAQALELGRAGDASMHIAPLLASHPDHPEILRLHAGILTARGLHADAARAVQRALAQRPDDALYHNTYGMILGSAGEIDAAIDAFTRACELAPGLAVAWFNLGIMLTRCVRHEEATQALLRAVELAPDNMAARAQLGDMLRVGGHIEDATTQYRKVLAEQPWAGMAWWGLADIRSIPFAPGDTETMQAALRDPRAGDGDRIAIGFALAMALDHAGQYVASLDALQHANAIARARQRWDAAGFTAAMAASNAVFTPPPAPAPAAGLGGEVVFVAGMPRSGTTLVEQILASHSQVEGSGELPDLPQVLNEESRRRGAAFPQWVAQAHPGDWQRLGERYLERTARWHRQRPRFVDKLPGNWMYIGAIRAMLPGAHVVVSRRDPLETCFSCYRQHLAHNEYTRTFEDLAAYWRDFDHAATHWAALHPAHVFQHDHEALLAHPEQGIRKLLDFCGLPFEEACLDFHRTEREVRSPSATQVRQPLRQDTAHARRYGTLLDPLRKALGLPGFGA